MVVTLGAGGARWTDGVAHAAVRAVRLDDVRDTTGAGDAFAAGFLVGLAGAAGGSAGAPACGWPRRRCSPAWRTSYD